MPIPIAPALVGAAVPSAYLSLLPSAASASSGASSLLLAEHQPYAEPREAAALHGTLKHLQKPPAGSSFYSAHVGETPVLIYVATRDAPQQWRSQVAFYRLAIALGLTVVPPTTWQAVAFSSLLGAASEEAVRRSLREEASVRPDGCVPVTITALVAGAKPRNVGVLSPSKVQEGANSPEEKRWLQLAESERPVRAAWMRTVKRFVMVRVLDYIAGNVGRKRVEEDRQGRWWLVDNRSAMAEHPQPSATGASFDAIKRLTHFPAGLATGLHRFDMMYARDTLQPGAYEEWLAQARPLREMVLRARAVTSIIEAHRNERGNETLVPDVE